MGDDLKAVLDAAEPFAQAWAMLPEWVNESDEISIVGKDGAFLNLMVINLRRLALAVEDYHCRAGASDEGEAELTEERVVIDREHLADVMHQIWACSMHYLFLCGEFNADGSWTMPAEKAERWMRQLGSKYEALTEEEKELARYQADRVIAAIQDSITVQELSALAGALAAAARKQRQACLPDGQRKFRWLGYGVIIAELDDALAAWDAAQRGGTVQQGDKGR